MDTQSIQDSVRTLNSSIDQLGDKFDSLNSDMVRTESSSKGISKSFIGIGAASLGLFAIAKNAPAVSGAMADMQVSMMGISFALGESLAPAFDSAAEGMSEFSKWLNDNEDLVSSVGFAISDVLVLSIDSLTGAWATLESLGIPTGLKWLLDNFGPEIALGLIGGKVGGLPGAAVGFAGGAVISDIAAGEEALLGESLAAVGIIGGAVAGPLGSVAGGALGYGVGEIIEELISLIIGSKNQNSTNKSISMNQSDSMIIL